MTDDQNFFNRKTRIISPDDPILNQPQAAKNAKTIRIDDEPPAVAPSSESNTASQNDAPSGLKAPLNATVVWQPDNVTPNHDNNTQSPTVTVEENSGTHFELTVAWLVILDGPGKGHSLPLGYGANSIGRDPSQKIALPFGDPKISRENQCVVTYDGKNRKYYIQHGGGRNITYLNDQPVLSPVEIDNGAIITVGDSKLQLVTFCGEGFDWESPLQKASSNDHT